MKPALLLDLDGTLIDTAPDLARAMNRTLADLGLAPVDPFDVRRLTGRGARALIERGVALTAPGLVYDVEDAVRRFLDHYARAISIDSRPFPDVEDTLDHFRHAGWSTAICTNKPETLARKLVNALDLDRRIDALVGGDTVGVTKPDPAPVFAAMEAVGAVEGVFVGDSAVDVAAARAAALPVAIADYGYADEPPSTLGADAVFSAFGDLATIVPSLRRMVDATR